MSDVVSPFGQGKEGDEEISNNQVTIAERYILINSSFTMFTLLSLVYLKTD